MVRASYNMDWAFALVGWLRKAVEQHYRSDLHRWPVLNTFDAEIYRASDSIRLFILRDKSSTSAIPTINSDSDAKDWPHAGERITEDLFDSTRLLQVLERVHQEFNLRQQDLAVFLPELGAQSTSDEFNLWTPEMKLAVNVQLSDALNRQLHYVRGFDTVGNFMLHPGYEFLSRECERFFRDHPHYDRNIFLMTRFDPGDKLLVTLDQELRRILREHDLNPVRADDRMYLSGRNLWNNVCVYMLCSARGIAILEDRAANEFNPNVAIEYGFMRALNKPTLLLADKGFRNLRADIIGTLREIFDLADIETTVQPAVERWLSDFDRL